jgi:hypothetical protein
VSRQFNSILTECRIELCTDDLFAYLESKLSAEQLPTLKALENIAKILHRCYSSLRAYHRALFEHDSEDVYSVKLGSPWTQPDVEESSQNIGSGMATKK